MNPHALGCYAAARARVPIDDGAAAWATEKESLYLLKPSREVLATVMSFNASWLRADFAPRYWAKVDALLAAGQFSTEQSVLTMMAAEAADGFELVPTENYRYIARKMLNCP